MAKLGNWIFGKHEKPAGNTCPYSWGHAARPFEHVHMCQEDAGHGGKHKCTICPQEHA
jgi:hypothetical protein